MEHYLSQRQRTFARRVASEGTRFQQGVLDWVLENLGPLKFDGAIHRVYYEELSLHPERVCGELARRFNLSAPRQMVRQVVERPSSATFGSATTVAEAVRSQDRWPLVSRWMDEVGDAEREAGQEVLDAFEIDFYRMNEPLPVAPALPAAASSVGRWAAVG